MWIRTSRCNRCGDCCDPKFLPARLNAYLDMGIKPVFNEDHLRKGCCPDFRRTPDGKGFCFIYATRPEVCIRFPVRPADTMALPRCSFNFVWKPDTRFIFSIV